MSERQGHGCDALMLMCMDFRFRGWIPDKVAEKVGASSYDLISYAGGALLLGSDDPTEREVLLSQIKLSSKLHGIKAAILVDHEDCGAYGGSKAFASSHEEFECHRAKMGKAEAAIKEALPNLEVVKAYAWMDRSVHIL